MSGAITRKNNLGVRRRTHKRSRSNRSRGLLSKKRGFVGRRLSRRLTGRKGRRLLSKKKLLSMKMGFVGRRLSRRLSRRLRVLSKKGVVGRDAGLSRRRLSGGIYTPPARRVKLLTESFEEKIERERREREANNIADAKNQQKINEDERIKAQTYEIKQEENRAIKNRERTEKANKKATELAGLKPETGIGESGFGERYKENLEGNKLHEIQNRLDSLIAGLEANPKNSVEANKFKQKLNELTQQTDILSQTMKTQTNIP